MNYNFHYKYLIIFLICFTSFLLTLVCCVDFPEDSDKPLLTQYNSLLFYINSLSETIDVILLDTNERIKDITLTGKFPNSLSINNEALYIINSGDNSLQIVDFDQRFEDIKIVFNTNSNPYNLIFDPSNSSKCFVTNWLKNSVLKVNLNNNSVDNELSLFNINRPSNQEPHPQGMCIVNNYLYVGDTYYNFSNNNYDTGAISIIDLTTFQYIKEIATSLNPQGLCYIKESNEIHIYCSGPLLSTTPTSYVNVLDLNNEQLTNPITYNDVIYDFASDFDNNIIYLASQKGIMAYNYINKSKIYDEVSCLKLLSSSSEFYSSIICYSGKLYVSAFNSSKIITYNIMNKSVENIIDSGAGPISLVLYNK